MNEQFKCDICGKTKTNTSEISTGYGITPDDKKACYECCAIKDKKAMKELGYYSLYLTTNKDTGCYQITNWPGSLSFNVRHRRVGKHNIAGKRYDIWFAFDGYIWHGVTYGDNTQICHCKRTKEKI